MNRTMSAIVACFLLAGLVGCGGSSGSSRARQGSTSGGQTGAAAPSTDPDAGSADRDGGASTSGSSWALTGTFGSAATFGRRASASDRSAVVAALRGYLSDVATGRWAAACGDLSNPIKHDLAVALSRTRGVRGRGCAPALGALLGRVPISLRREQVDFKVIGVRTGRDQALVFYRSPQLRHAAMSMLRESGRWTAGPLAGRATALRR
jgi:hypothetical protein